jgi:hypothetical protein
MGQVTIYLDDETEQRARAAARSGGVSLSKWVGDRIRQGTRAEWSPSFRALAGAWQDAPSARQIRKGQGRDIPRRRL